MNIFKPFLVTGTRDVLKQVDEMIETEGVWTDLDLNEKFIDEGQLVFGESTQELEKLSKKILFETGETCNLIVDSNRAAYLNYKDHNAPLKGKWREVSEQEAKENDHTYVMGRYFRVK